MINSQIHMQYRSKSQIHSDGALDQTYLRSEEAPVDQIHYIGSGRESPNNRKSEETKHSKEPNVIVDDFFSSGNSGAREVLE